MIAETVLRYLVVLTLMKFLPLTLNNPILGYFCILLLLLFSLLARARNSSLYPQIEDDSIDDSAPFQREEMSLVTYDSVIANFSLMVSLFFLVYLTCWIVLMVSVSSVKDNVLKS